MFIMSEKKKEKKKRMYNLKIKIGSPVFYSVKVQKEETLSSALGDQQINYYYI